MRIISGSARGKKLFSPKDDSIRPTTDRIKESIFNIINQKVYECVFVDLFAGSGSMGLEALSRGAEKVYFCDKDSESIDLAKKNLNHTNLDQSRCEFINMDYRKSLESLGRKGVKADVIFLDPPYDIEGLEEIINKIQSLELLGLGGILILEHDINRNIDKNMIKYKWKSKKKYGNTGIEIFRNQVVE
ncbi:16S rRNA (guanine(966)-N(2))-methyltransferase RsmD [Alkalibacter saccharofermentans]|uniref:16S rRNA (Guanine(966)-N(2))-methyltransferase RsmD n=1 Tax=Alkalibacter saccharofermentans DSM 14828 TaxID=1120975 RepID=A0A1M4S5E1_9FIRM|nr:16S rRNA (guanine(966)-N(2))-methyltransferase RsmD [Alkalibacter saccharofermentans]SHE27390.1 16S rRNA (guanine(966)-N(2))-methyltransferase RsmD [Alkalibacter saccharofermentans DSM 14828]